MLDYPGRDLELIGDFIYGEVLLVHRQDLIERRQELRGKRPSRRLTFRRLKIIDDRAQLVTETQSIAYSPRESKLVAP